MLLTFTAAFILYIYFMSLLYLYLCLYIIWLRTECCYWLSLNIYIAGLNFGCFVGIIVQILSSLPRYKVTITILTINQPRVYESLSVCPNSHFS